MCEKEIFGDDTGVVILAAGFSKRMQYPKPFLKFDEKRYFIDKIIEDYAEFGCRKIIIVINFKHEEWKEYRTKFAYTENVIFIINEHPEFERFFSIISGLREMNDCQYCFIHNVDNPFIGPSILRKIYGLKSDYGFVVPNNKGVGGHPILLSREIMNNLVNMQDHNVTLKEVLALHNRFDLEIGAKEILININTMDEYKKYFKF